MYCPKCGKKQGNDKVAFCDQCGYKFVPKSAQNINSNPANQNMPSQNIPPYKPPVQNNYNAPSAGAKTSSQFNNSYFDGTGIQLIGWNIWSTIFSVITLGFGAPYMCCQKIRWETKHTVVNGKRLYFNGTAWQFFGRMILWELILGAIMIIPVIIAVCSSYVKYTSYFYSHTVFSYTKFLSFLPIILLVDILVGIFGKAFFTVYIKKWVVKHTTYYDDKGYNFNYGALYPAPPQNNYIPKQNNIPAPNPQAPNGNVSKPVNNITSKSFTPDINSKANAEKPQNNDVQKSQEYNNSTLKNNTNFNNTNTESQTKALETKNNFEPQNYDNSRIKHTEINTNAEYNNYGAQYFSDNSVDNEKVYCPICSAEITYGVDSCPNCGSVFRWE